MDRRQPLAAEIHGYSYDNYHDHLGINPYFTLTEQDRRLCSVTLSLVAESNLIRYLYEFGVDS